ncbi:hypothetical protein D3C87_1821380 [compost metagenome]
MHPVDEQRQRLIQVLPRQLRHAALRIRAERNLQVDSGRDGIICPLEVQADLPEIRRG